VKCDLSYSERTRVWEDYLERVNRTITSLAEMNQACEDTIKSMWLINSQIFDTVRASLGMKKLPNYQAFVSVYYKRNIIYLQSSHALACIGFIDPSSNLNRTVFETILRSYLFVVEHEEADRYFQVIDTAEEESYKIKKGVTYLRGKMYSPKTSEQLRNLYKELCISAHPNIKGAALDYPEYLPHRIEDNLKMIQSLTYGNIQVMAECFLDFLSSLTRKIIKASMERIASTLKAVPTLEPDKDSYSEKIRLKRGNFLKSL
jgi:hypothetical protein